MTSLVKTLLVKRLLLKISLVKILSIPLVVGSISLSLYAPVQAANTQRNSQNAYQTYVIHTYGGVALLPAVRQQLSTSADGGSASIYQDKLVLNTTARNYQDIQQLLSQVDRQPQALTVSVRVGNSSSNQSNINQGRVTINNHGIQGSGIISQNNVQQQNNSLYQVQTLSGSAASISTGTLWSLTQNNSINSYQNSRYSNNSHSNNGYPNSHRPSGQIIIQQQILLPTTQGIQVVPRLLADGRIDVHLSQVEEQRSNLSTNSNTSYNRSVYNNDPNNVIERQALNTHIIVPRGQWVNIGQIMQSTQTQGSGYNSTSINNSAPIQLLVQ